MKGYVYILLSGKDRKSYVGSTKNLAARLSQHQNGQVQSTKSRMPLRLIYQEEFDTLAQARLRERCLKTRQGRRELKSIFESLDI